MAGNDECKVDLSSVPRSCVTGRGFVDACLIVFKHIDNFYRSSQLTLLHEASVIMVF